MFVEKLSLFGFKSFNTRVTLDFDAGISSVIGPNGCGKSNIVDAIRWVLGEQSTKQLRGSKMEDVIFNGTRHEKPLSMAEVELTLNNDRGRLAIDYGTVSVARRLYRSGLSEYLINRKPVRLKDVRDLFMDTGMGSHAYSVIERQMVDNILSDTTGHRRFLFEEAAGIMKYKTRKKEALGKLDATERDLVRVDDIITEVDRQVISLKRQVGRARKYRELMDEIRDLDLAHSQIRRRRWQEELRTLDAHYDGVLRTAESGETEVATLDARLEEIHLAVLREEASLSEARELLAQVDDEVGRANSRILVLRERMDATRQRIAEAGELKVRLTDRKERNGVAGDEVAARLAALEIRGTEEKEHLDAKERTFEAAEARVRERRQSVESRRAELARLHDEQVRSEGDVQLTERRLQDLDSRIETVTRRHGEEEREAAELREALEVSGNHVARSLEQVEGVGEEIRVHEVRRENHRSRTEVLRKNLAENREKEAGAKSRLHTLEDLEARYEGFDAGVRALVLESDRHPGMLGTIGDLLRIPGEWRTPLEPALSRIWQYVVVEDTATARHLLQRLREESLGYATLIPLDRVPDTPERGGDLTWAADVVTVDARYRKLVRYLLDGLALVKDLDAGFKAVRDGAARCAATRTGQVVDVLTVAGGKGGPQGSDLVERTEALERCRKSLTVLAGTLADLGEHETELAEEGRNLARESEALAARREEVLAARATLEKEEAGLALQIRHREAALRDLERERDALVAERESLAREKESGTGRAAASAAAAGDAARVAGAEETALREAEAAREAALAEVHERRMAWARLESELKDAGATGERLAAERNDLEAEWDRTVREEAENRRRVEEIEHDLEELGQKVQELHGLRDQRALVVAEREREKAEAAAREQQDAEALREVRRRATQARQEAHQAELRLSELRGELKHLEERLFEEYEVEPAALDALPDVPLPEDAPRMLAEMKERIRRLGPVNLLAVEEYEEKSRRLEFMTTQRDDLARARESLLKSIEEINKTASGMFLETFAQVQQNFQQTFQVLFQGGECSLTLTGDDPLEADIEVLARPRGKKPQSIAQLSSGERALTAIALLFAIYLVKPSPFCILDEVDAPLDDANIDRFVAMVKEFSKRTQFIVITHNKKTMEAADCLYGVTMQRPGVSSVVSVQLNGNRADGNGNGNGEYAGDPLSPESAIAH